MSVWFEAKLVTIVNVSPTIIQLVNDIMVVHVFMLNTHHDACVT